MSDATLNKGKVSRKLVPYAGIALVLVASVGFLIQMGASDEKKDVALKDKERLEALQREVVTEEDARRELASKEEAARKEIAERERLRAASAPPDRMPVRLPPPAFDDGSMRAYEAARTAAAPSSREKMSMVAFEDFPGAKKPLGGVVQQQPAPASERRDAKADDTPPPPKEEDRNRAWADKTEGRIKAGTSEFLKPEVLAVKSVLLQGTIINAVMRTALNTKLPGQIVASVTQDVYDSVHGEAVLLPRGSQLLGEYNTSVMDGQERVMMAFTRLVLPSGASVKLGAMSASDALGIAGVEGKLNSHFFKRLGSSMVIALLASAVKPPESVTIVNTGESSGSTTAAGEVLSAAADQELQRSANITPDISLPPGAKVSLILAADLALPPSITRKLPTED